MQGKLSISRVISGGENAINITVSEAGTGLHFLDLMISLEDFAYAITGVGRQPCTFEVPEVAQSGRRDRPAV